MSAAIAYCTQFGVSFGISILPFCLILVVVILWVDKMAEGRIFNDEKAAAAFVAFGVVINFLLCLALGTLLYNLVPLC